MGGRRFSEITRSPVQQAPSPTVLEAVTEGEGVWGGVTPEAAEAGAEGGEGVVQEGGATGEIGKATTRNESEAALASSPAASNSAPAPDSAPSVPPKTEEDLQVLEKRLKDVPQLPPTPHYRHDQTQSPPSSGM